MEYLLGIDVGTSATKVVAIDRRGSIAAQADASYGISMPQPGWSEQDPDWWWRATCEATRAVLSRGPISAREIVGIGLSGQMHGSVLLPRSATPDRPDVVRPAILWNDQRTSVECEEMERVAGGRAALTKLVGNRALTGFTASKLLWLKCHEPRHYERSACLLLPKDYVGFRLTGERVTDVGDASGTLLLDPRTRNWRLDLVSALKLDVSMLPPCVESTARVGAVSAWASEQTGLAPGTCVIAGSGDQMTGAVGMGVVVPGVVSATLGTSGVIYAHAGTSPPANPDGRLQVMCAAVPGEYCVYGCMLSAAGALLWFRNTLAPGASFQQLDEEAMAVSPGSDGLIFLPYLTGERCPHADPLARAVWIGLTGRHSRAHMTRSVMEGVTFGMAAMLDLICGLGIAPREIRLGGGGASSALWREIQAAIYKAPVSMLRTTEGSAYGAALLAGVGVGCWSNVAAACETCLPAASSVEPKDADITRYDAARRIYETLYPALRESFVSLASLST